MLKHVANVLVNVDDGGSRRGGFGGGRGGGFRGGDRRDSPYGDRRGKYDLHKNNTLLIVTITILWSDRHLDFFSIFRSTASNPNL